MMALPGTGPVKTTAPKPKEWNRGKWRDDGSITGAYAKWRKKKMQTARRSRSINHAKAKK